MSRLDGYVVRSEPIRERPVTYVYFASFLVCVCGTIHFSNTVTFSSAMLAFVNVATSHTLCGGILTQFED